MKKVMKRIAIVGGTQTSTFKQIGERYNLEIIHHPGKVKGKCLKKFFTQFLSRVDGVVILRGALDHQSLWKVKEISKKLGIPINSHKGRGVTGAIQKAIIL